jgi:glucose-6-phosphate 1-dehydrogenase
MDVPHSDALVFFGATGDLAYKKIFPSLHAMVKRGNLGVPVIGVAKSGWNVSQLRARARESIEQHGGLDPSAFEKLCGLLRYIDGDYRDPATFHRLRKELGVFAAVSLHQFKAQNATIEANCSFQVRDFEMHMTNAHSRVNRSKSISTCLPLR